MSRRFLGGRCWRRKLREKCRLRNQNTWKLRRDGCKMSEIREECVVGFCRTCNGIQSVCCEYQKTEQGWRLDVMYCQEKNCVHHAGCEIYRQAHEMESKENA